MAANLAYRRPVLIAARLSGWALTALLILAILAAAQWLGRWYVGREAEQAAKRRAQDAAVAACLRSEPALARNDCEAAVREAEVRRGD